jgi:1-deoxy-D-xylulose-5-phosphate synthase
MISLLEQIREPGDLKRLSRAQMDALAEEIRVTLTKHVLQNGGHLGPNLGVVELTLALHRVFDSPSDAIVWDTGHQAYVHKMVTGRARDMGRLRKRNGLSGYPDRGESRHDLVANSHASTALAYADGIAIAASRRSQEHRRVVAVIGDGALTGGMSWEGLNNVAQRRGSPVIVVVNDNGRSYDPTIGGFASAFSRGACGHPSDAAAVEPHHNAVAAALGFAYVGPLDGHDLHQLEDGLRLASSLGRPVIVHCMTQKGRGYPLAEADENDRLHTVGANGRRSTMAGRKTWTDVFGEALVEIAEERPDVVAVTAAMRMPVGLQRLAARFPERMVDVGIAEQHAVASAAGMAANGLHPVVAIYSTFANMAFDQMLMDVALHRSAVTLVADRAGITGDDGATHNGVWDMSLFQVIPGLRIAAPRDEPTLRRLFAEAVAVPGPTVVRFPKGAVPRPLLSEYEYSGMDVLVSSPFRDILVVSIGAMAQTCMEVATTLQSQNIGVTVVDPGWIAPVNPAFRQLAREYALVVSVEDGVCVGGVGSELRAELDRADALCRFRAFGVPKAYLRHGTRSEVLAEVGLDTASLVESIRSVWQGTAPSGVAGARGKPTKAAVGLAN